jgi:hypothetical protein
VKKDEMGRACKPAWGEEECKQGFDSKTGIENTTTKA